MFQIPSKISYAVIGALFFYSSIANAICLSNCEEDKPRPAIALDSTGFGEASKNGEFRDRNLKMGDVKNSVLGDVNIRVGHKNLEIKNDSNSNNNTIDASINSTIILGDMTK